MKIKHGKLIVLSILMLALFSGVTIAADPGIGDIVKSLEVLDVSSVYKADSPDGATYIIDFILFIVFFIGIAKFALSSYLEEKPGAGMITYALAFMLALGAVVAERKMSFVLGQLGTFWLLIVFVALGYLLYKLFDGMGFMSTKLGKAVFMLIIWFFMTMVDDPLKGFAINTWILLIETILLIGGLIFSISSVFGLFGGNLTIDKTASAFKKVLTHPDGKKAGLKELGKGLLPETFKTDEDKKKEKDIEKINQEIERIHSGFKDIDNESLSFFNQWGQYFGNLSNWFKNIEGQLGLIDPQRDFPTFQDFSAKALTFLDGVKKILHQLQENKKELNKNYTEYENKEIALLEEKTGRVQSTINLVTHELGRGNILDTTFKDSPLKTKLLNYFNSVVKQPLDYVLTSANEIEKVLLDGVEEFNKEFKKKNRLINQLKLEPTYKIILDRISEYAQKCSSFTNSDDKENEIKDIIRLLGEMITFCNETKVLSVKDDNEEALIEMKLNAQSIINNINLRFDAFDNKTKPVLEQGKIGIQKFDNAVEKTQQSYKEEAEHLHGEIKRFRNDLESEFILEKELKEEFIELEQELNQDLGAVQGTRFDDTLKKTHELAKKLKKRTTRDVRKHDFKKLVNTIHDFANKGFVVDDFLSNLKADDQKMEVFRKQILLDVSDIADRMSELEEGNLRQSFANFYQQYHSKFNEVERNVAGIIELLKEIEKKVLSITN